MPDMQQLGDILAGAAGHPVNRQGLNAYVANSQAMNGLRSAQTEEALLKAQESVDQQDASSKIEAALGDVFGPDHQAEAHLAAVGLRAKFGNMKQVADGIGQFQQNSFRGTLGDPNQLGQPTQTAAQQGVQGKVATPVAVPDNFTTLPGAFQPNVQQTPEGQAVTAQHVANAEELHHKATAAVAPGSTMDPGALDTAALVVMADPTKMGQYAGFGQAGQNIKIGINNRIAQKLTAAGMTPEDMIRQRAIAKANVGGAAQAAKQAETLDAFTPLVRSNSDRLMQLLDQIGDNGAGLPILAGLERSLGRNLGSDDLAELHSVFTTYQNEIARLLAAGPSMNGVISDKARGEIQAMAPENMTASQARRVLNRVNLEIGIRRQGVQAALDNATGAQLPVTSVGGPQTGAKGGGGAGTGTATPAAPGGVMSLDDYLKAHGH